ncbi:MAG: MlaD family protein, partial [Caulobacteraceae bacterium]
MPVAVIAVAAWLGIRHLASGGDKATVFFDNAYGLSPGSSPVTFRGVTVGDVSEVEPTSDGRGVAVTIELKRKYGGYLRRDTRFWLVGAEVSLADLSTLKSVIAGPHIALEPGSGPSAHRFEGQDQPPAVPFPTAGSNYTLLADHLGPVGSGSPVYFEGKEVGKITSARFEGPHRFALTAFIRAPFDRLVGSQTRFWDASAVRVSASGAGLKARLVSPAALLTGSVAFEAPTAASGGAPAPAGASFPLFDDERSAEDAPIGPQVRYLVRFTGPVGDLEKGAAVKMRGFRVGEVTSVELRYNAQTGRMEA